jgi:hypothetical protein
MSKLLQERLLAQREALDAAIAVLRAAGAGAAASAPAGQQEALDASLPDQAPPVPDQAPMAILAERNRIRRGGKATVAVLQALLSENPTTE